MPGSTISSPVENTATRTRRRTASAVRPTAAASATSCGGEPPAGRQHDRAGAHVLAGEPPVGAALEARRHDHGLRPRARTSSCMNTVSAPAGIGAPVKMRIASPAPQRARGGAAGGHALDDREPRSRASTVEIGVAHGVAVDRRIVERRQIDRCDDVARDHAPARGVERHGLDLGDRRDALGDDALDLIDRQQRTGEREAVVGELRHQPCSSARQHGVERRGVPQQNVDDALDVVEIDHRHARRRQRLRRRRSRRSPDRRDAAAACRPRRGRLRAWDAARACSLRPARDRPATAAEQRSERRARPRRATRAPAPSGSPSRPAPRSRRPCDGCGNPCPAGRRRSRDGRA